MPNKINQIKQMPINILRNLLKITIKNKKKAIIKFFEKLIFLRGYVNTLICGENSNNLNKLYPFLYPHKMFNG